MQLLPARYNQYLFGHMVGPALFIAMSLTAILWLAQSLRFVDMIVNRGLSLSTFLYLTVLLLPSVFGLVLPVGLMCACIYAYQRLLNDSELIVMSSIGLSPLQLAKPVMQLAVLFLMGGYLISLYILPLSYREFKDMQFFIRNHYAQLLLQEGVFNNPVDGLTVYLREREEDGTLHGILVHDSRVKTKPVTMMAESGQLVRTDQGPRFLLEKGNRQERDGETGSVSLLHFDSYTLDLSVFTKSDTGWRRREPKERFIDELLYPEPSANASFRAELRAELHQRISWPLFNLALPLVAMAWLLTGERNRRGIWKRILAASLCDIGVVAYGVGMSEVLTKRPELTALLYSGMALAVIIPLIILAWPARKGSPHQGAIA